MTERYKVIEVTIPPDIKWRLETEARVTDIVKNLKEIDFALDRNEYPTSFAKNIRQKAVTALFYIGDFMETNDKETVYYLRSRTRFILDQLEIPYKKLEGGE